jgi:AcrR family transcriptional regulator
MPEEAPEARLTRGGFYGHFASKDALMAEAMAHAVDRSMAWQERLGSLSELVAGYLSDRHRADRANGSPWPRSAPTSPATARPCARR